MSFILYLLAKSLISFIEQGLLQCFIKDFLAIRDFFIF